MEKYLKDFQFLTSKYVYGVGEITIFAMNRNDVVF